MKTALHPPDQRRLAVVMFLDMVGYSARMASDERNAMACVDDLEAILHETVGEHRGRLVKFMGDGSMSHFPTAGEAVACALELLGKIRERNVLFPPRQRFQVRIGLHLGDVVFEQGDLFGDAVNVTARVQPLADPGGIAMTGIVYAQVRNKMSLPGSFLPPVKLKNIPVAIPIYSVAPREKNLFLWKMRLRRRELQWAFLLLIACLGVGNMGYFRNRLDPPKWALMGVLSPGDETSRKMAEGVRMRAEMDFNGLTGMQWVKPETAQALLKQNGVAEPTASLDNLDLTACHTAWKMGLKYLLLLRLAPEGPKGWGLQLRIINPQSRASVAAFWVEGPNPILLVNRLLKDTELWNQKNNV